ncbi:MAG: glycosyltransferase family 2 protein [Candidatus Omnitrophica bacterium]|nr:glycosyltransferase family 2 protein [Candidatus Omnitrophota bacterium]
MDTKTGVGLVSVVIPAHNEEGSILEVYRQTAAVLSSLELCYEIIFVDDASTDETAAILKKIEAQDGHIRILRFAKNRGQSYAFLAGFRAARGDIIITMDADLQNDPADIKQLLAQIGEGADFVNGWRHDRKDSIFRKTVSGLENLLIAARTGVKLRDYGCALTAARKEVIAKVLACGSSSRFIKPLAAVLTDSVCEVAVSHSKRSSGRSKYGFFNIARAGADFLINFRLSSIKDKKDCAVKEVDRA